MQQEIQQRIINIVNNVILHPNTAINDEVAWKEFEMIATIGYQLKLEDNTKQSKLKLINDLKNKLK
jgi:hypothetical protein